MEIEINIGIPKRAMDTIRQYCSINNLNLEEYLSDCIVTQNNIDRYGDLNHKYNKTVEIKSIPKEEINHYVVNHKVETIKTDEKVRKSENVENIDVKTQQHNEDNKAEETINNEVKPKIKRHRTIKAK